MAMRFVLVELACPYWIEVKRRLLNKMLTLDIWIVQIEHISSSLFTFFCLLFCKLEFWIQVWYKVASVDTILAIHFQRLSLKKKKYMHLRLYSRTLYWIENISNGLITLLTSTIAYFYSSSRHKRSNCICLLPSNAKEENVTHTQHIFPLIYIIPTQITNL